MLPVHTRGITHISLRINLHLRLDVVVLHIRLLHGPAPLDRLDPLPQPILLLDALVHTCLTDPRDTRAGDHSREHRSHDDGFDGGDTGVWIAHLGPGNHAALEHVRRLDAERSRVPDDQVGQLAHFDGAEQVAHALRQRRVNRVLAHVPLDAEVVGARAGVFGQEAPLHFVFVRRVPCPEDHFAAPAHGLAVGAHHADGAQIVQYVFGCDRFGSDPALGEGDVLGDIATQVVTHHQHVEVLVESVASIWTGRVGGRGEHIVVLHDGDDVRCMSASGTLRMVGVDGTVFEGRDCGLNEAGFIERVCVDQGLDVVLVAYAG